MARAGSLLLLASFGCLRGGEAAPAADGFVARTVSEYWNPPNGQRDRPQRIDLELAIDFYDPEWRLLWAEASDGASWFDNSGVPLPIKSGQRVHLDGTYVPARGLDGSTLHVRVLSEHVIHSPRQIEKVDDFPAYDGRWVAMDGFVVGQKDFDPTHIEYDLLRQGRVMTIYLPISPMEPVPQLAGHFVRAQFVYASRHDPAGHLLHLDGWIPHAANFSPGGALDADERMLQPVTPIERIGASEPGSWLHVAGTLAATEPGRSITIRDSTGEIRLATEQVLSAKPGAHIDAIARLARAGLAPSLSDPIFREGGPDGRVAGDDGGNKPLLRLRVAEQVMALSARDASSHYPVSIRGVVTWAAADAPFFFVQDASGGIRVQRGARSDPAPGVGDFVAVEGTSNLGAFSPELSLGHVTRVGTLDLPQVRPLSLDEALTGVMEAQRVEMHGLLRAVGREGSWTALDVTTPTGEFRALMQATDQMNPLAGSIVRIDGVCAGVADTDRKLNAVRLWVADPGDVHVVFPRAADPFTAPKRTLASLRQYAPGRNPDQPVCVSGAVLFDRPGKWIYLQERNTGMLVLRRDDVRLEPGTWIEAVGIPGREGRRVVLREAQWRTIDRGPTPVAERFDPTRVDVALDGRLVRVDGLVTERVSDGTDGRLRIRAGAAQFEAQTTGVGLDALPAEGSAVSLTGVYVVEYDEYRQPAFFSLLVRRPADIVVRARPPWWTAPRALAVAGGFAGFALLGIAWVVVLRRRVRQQTEQIRAQLEKEKRLDAELERGARLESLGLLAGGIAHDFNNLLTVVIANLGLAAMDERVRAAAGDYLADAERGARRAAELTQQLLTFAKGGDPVRRAVSLPEVVRESAEFAGHGARVRCTFDFEPNLPPANVDRGQVSRVVHNLVLNATQAMPHGGMIRLRLASVEVTAGEEPRLAAGRYVKLSVSDEGPGIAPEHLARIFDPYFSTKPNNSGLGLATVHSIVTKHHGHIRVQSELGHGTTIDIWLPAAAEAPAPAPPAAVFPERAAVARVLFMDDDEIIRRTAKCLFEQLGHDARIVADGMEAVREYEAALTAGRKYDVVILDLTVPGGVGGRAAMEILRRVDPNIRAIVSSGYSNDPVLSDFRRFGFSAVVPKPYVIEELARAIQQVLGMPAVAGAATPTV